MAGGLVYGIFFFLSRDLSKSFTPTVLYYLIIKETSRPKSSIP